MGHIRVTGLGKAYKQYPNRWARLAEWLIPFSPIRHQQHWVLQDVEFEITPGEAVIIFSKVLLPQPLRPAWRRRRWSCRCASDGPGRTRQWWRAASRLRTTS